MVVKVDGIQEGDNGRDRDRTDDLYRVKVALIPTELRARKLTVIVRGEGKGVNGSKW